MSILLSNMFSLAQAGAETASSDPSIAHRVADVTVDPLRVLLTGLDRADILNHPAQLTDPLSQLHIIWGVIFVILGLLAITNGYQWRTWIVMILSFIVGLEIGSWVSQSMAVSAVVAGSVGVLVAIVAWPLMKYAITLCGALAGAFVGANVWTAVGQPEDSYVAGALIGFIVFGMLAFMAHRVVTVAMTCVVGSVLLVLGLLSLMLKVQGWQDGLSGSFESNTLVIPLITLVIAVFGFVVQQGSAFAASSQKKSEAKPAAA